MSDTYQRYGAIKQALMRHFPPFCGQRGVRKPLKGAFYPSDSAATSTC